MKCYTHVLWDFNGTLLDDVRAGMDSANRLLTAHGLAPLVSLDAYRAEFGFPIKDYYRRLGFDFEKTPYEELAREWVPYYLDCSRSTGLAADAEEALRTCEALGLSQVVLSASERDMLEGQIEALGIRPYLAEVLGLNNIHAHSKEHVGMEWRQRHPTARALLVGDTLHDASVARAIGADCILLACGHQSRVRLETAKPLFVADSLHDVAEWLRKKA